MGSLLIVDDEAYAVEGIKSSLDAESLGIEHIYVAFNASQAREILMTDAIDVVLCDIEMPEENGLDLLAWIRAGDLECEVIFLTCHCEFSLAKQAIKLRGFDYLVKPVPLAELNEVVVKALRFARGCSAGAVPVEEALAKKRPLDLAFPGLGGRVPDIPDMSLWSMLLKSDAVEKVRCEIRIFLDGLSPKAKEDPAFLQRFLLDFQQVVLAVLKARGVAAHAIIDDAAAATLFQRAASSVRDLERWVDYALDCVEDQKDGASKPDVPFRRATEYIAKNLYRESLSCEKIASHVGLNSDYLTRLFKKETGLSVSAYINHEKMRIAKELLVSTTLPVGEISGRLGYLNPAHFSSAFKRFYHDSPVDFRNKNARASAVDKNNDKR